MTVCDGCLTAIYDEGGQDLSRSEQIQLAKTMGADDTYANRVILAIYKERVSA